jgi:transposase InsO family protein
VTDCRRLLSDNGRAYRCKPWLQTCEALGLIAKRTRHDTPRTNGKGERFSKTPMKEWGYWLSFQS